MTPMTSRIDNLRGRRGRQPTLTQACSCCASLLSIIGDFGCAAAVAAAVAAAGVWRRPTTKAVRHDRAARGRAPGSPAAEAAAGAHAGVVDKVLILRPCNLSAAQSLRARRGTAHSTYAATTASAVAGRTNYVEAPATILPRSHDLSSPARRLPGTYISTSLSLAYGTCTTL